MINRLNFKIFHNVIFSAILISMVSGVLANERIMTTSETLLDRIQIEDMFHDYYWELGKEDRSDMDKFWAKGAVFDLNGTVISGLEAIQAIYNADGRPEGTLITLMSNPRIHVNGNTATADIIYTGIRSMNPNSAPEFFEQGHDHVELIKLDGIWMISKRVLRNYSIDSQG